MASQGYNADLIYVSRRLLKVGKGVTETLLKLLFLTHATHSYLSLEERVICGVIGMSQLVE